MPLGLLASSFWHLALGRLGGGLRRGRALATLVSFLALLLGSGWVNLGALNSKP